MARTGRPKAELVLTPDEDEQLTRWARRATSAQALALRSKIVLACAAGLDNKTVAAQVGYEEHTVSKWGRRFVEQRLEGLGDEPRPGRPRSISVDQVEDVIVATLESTPPNATHWTRSRTAGPIGTMLETRLDKTITVNLRTPFLMLQRALPLLRQANGARVIVLSSLTGVYAKAGLAAYGATKVALNSIVDAFNAEESQGGVSATAIAPGYVDTDMAAWTHDRIPPDRMIPVSDVVTLVEALVALSPRSVVPRLTVTRAGTTGFEA